jgi:hypothetical protein
LSQLAWAHAHETLLWATKGKGYTFNYDLINSAQPGTQVSSVWRIPPPPKRERLHDYDTCGALKLTLHPEGYDWRFVPIEGEAFTDPGRARCHRRTLAPPHTSAGGRAVLLPAPRRARGTMNRTPKALPVDEVQGKRGSPCMLKANV